MARGSETKSAASDGEGSVAPFPDRRRARRDPPRDTYAPGLRRHALRLPGRRTSDGQLQLALFSGTPDRYQPYCIGGHDEVCPEGVRRLSDLCKIKCLEDDSTERVVVMQRLMARCGLFLLVCEHRTQ